jgi:hypothetical protein
MDVMVKRSNRELAEYRREFETADYGDYTVWCIEFSGTNGSTRRRVR